MVYAPSFIKRRYARKVRENKEKYSEIENAILSARLSTTTYELLALSLFYSIIAFVIGALAFAIITKLFLLSAISLFLDYYSAKILSYLSSTSFSSKFHIHFNPNLLHTLPYSPYYPYLFSLIPGYILYRLVKYLVLSYPFIVAGNRKSEIERYMPHAINMMYGMAVGGLNPVDIMREVSKLHNLFGELSVEFKEFIKSFEVFKRDVFTSLRYVRDTTPSKKFAGFIDSLIVVLQGGGSLSQYLKSKSEEFEEEQEIVFSESLSFMEVLFEVYISIFVMFPMMLLIVFVISKFFSNQMMDAYLKIIYITLPVATAFLIFIAISMSPYPKSEIGKAREIPVFSNFFIYNKNVKRYRIKKFRKILNTLLKFVLHPYTTPMHFLNMKIVTFHIFAYLAGIVYVLIRMGYFSVSDLAFPAFAVFLLLTVIVEIKNRIIRKAEERLPEFFSEIAMLNESGVSIFDGIRIVSASGKDVLSREFRIVAESIAHGLPVTKSIERILYRIRSDIFAKAIPIAVKALETNVSIKDAFTTVSRYIEAEINFRKKIKSAMMPYLAIVYMSVGVFIFVSYLLITKFLVVFSGMNTSFMGMTASLNVETVRDAFMKTIYLISFLSGIIAGVISEFRIEGGLKHAFILTFISYLAFTYFI